MTNVLFSLLLAFLAAFGLFRLVHLLLCSLFSEKKEATYWLIPAGGDGEDIEFKIKSAKLKMNALPGGEEHRIIVLDTGMSEQCRQIAGKEAADDARIVIMQANELKKLR